MSQRLQSTIERVRQLPDDQQDAVAELVLKEIESDQRWDRQFEGTSDELETAARAALDRDQRGQTVDKDWDAL